MSLNVEIKARTGNLNSLEQRLRDLTHQEPIILEQRDEFYRVTKGRLKVRCDEHGQCKVIYYHRENTKGPVVSSYFVKPLAEPDKAMDELRVRYGSSVVIKKLRKLFLIDDARVHLDSVSGLGDFIEIEVELDSMKWKNEATQKAKKLMRLLGIEAADLLSNSYEDMNKSL